MGQRVFRVIGNATRRCHFQGSMFCTTDVPTDARAQDLEPLRPRPACRQTFLASGHSPHLEAMAIPKRPRMCPTARDDEGLRRPNGPGSARLNTWFCSWWPVSPEVFRMNKHIVKHIVASYLGLETLQFSGSLMVNALFLGALCPSKSGLMNKHIVKHIVDTHLSFLVPCARLSPD